MTGGDAAEALSWLTDLDKRYNMTKPGYGIGDFIDDLKSKGYLDEKKGNGEIKITGKAEQSIRKMLWKKFSENLSGEKEDSTRPTTRDPERKEAQIADLLLLETI